MQKTNKRKIINLLSSFGCISLLSIPIITSCSGQFKKPYREDWDFIQWGDQKKKDVLNIGRLDASLKMKFINFDDNQEDQENQENPNLNPNILLHTKYDFYSSYDEFLKKRRLLLKQFNI